MGVGLTGEPVNLFSLNERCLSVIDVGTGINKWIHMTEKSGSSASSANTCSVQESGHLSLSLGIFSRNFFPISKTLLVPRPFA